MMTGTALALLLGLGGWAHAASTPDGEPLEKDNWNSVSMEGTAFLGELRYLNGDYKEADETFRDSLNSSMGVNLPQAGLIALDHYRRAELGISRGNVALAKQHLEILVARYPDTEWGRKGLSLLSALDTGEAREGHGSEYHDPTSMSERPAFQLSRIQEAAKTQPRLALALSQKFSSDHPHHPSAFEVRLLEGLLFLRLNDPASAALVLEPITREAGDAELRSKAVYLLGGAYAARGRYNEILELIPQVDPKKAWNKWVALSQVWVASAQEAKGETDEAADRYSRVIQYAPESVLKAHAYASLAQAQDKQGRIKSALKSITSAEQLAEKYGMTDLAADTALSKGHILYKLRRLEAAARSYGKLAQGWPGHPQRTIALFQQGLSLKRLGKTGAAANVFSALVGDYPDSVYAADAHLQLGEIYAKTGRKDRAIAHYTQMGHKGGEASRIESILLVARVHYNAKRFKEAIPLYWKFLEESPRDPRAHQVQELLLSAYWMGDRENPGLYKAAELYPNHAVVDRIRWHIARSAYKNGDCRQAVSNFDEFESKSPDSPRVPESLYLRGECLMNLGDWDKAARAFTELNTRFPSNSNARKAAFKAGQAHYRAGDHGAAIRAYRLPANGKDPMAADAVFNMALSYAKAGSSKSALKAYENLLERFPKYSQAGSVWLEVGKLREAVGQKAGAIKAYSRSRGHGPEALFRIGRLRESLNQPRLAAKIYQKLYKLRPKMDAYRLNGLVRLGLLYELQGRSMDAMRLYVEVLKGPRNQFFEVARKRLSALSKDGSLLSGR